MASAKALSNVRTISLTAVFGSVGKRGLVAAALFSYSAPSIRRGVWHTVHDFGPTEEPGAFMEGAARLHSRDSYGVVQV